MAAVLGILAAVFAALQLWSIPPLWGTVAVLAAALLAAWAMWAAFDAYASLGHALDADYLLPAAAVCGAAPSRCNAPESSAGASAQSPFQRRLGLITITATTAAGRGHYAVLDLDQNDGLDVAAQAVPDLLEPFLIR